MTKRFPLLATLAVLLATAAGPAALADLKIGVAAEPYPPFSSKDAAGKWVGWEIDLISALCAEMKEDCTITDVAWDGIIPALTSGKIDVIMSSMSVTAKRQEVISFSTPYYVSSPAVVGAKDGNKDIGSAQLSGKTIGVQVSTIHSAYAEKHLASMATIKTYQTQDEANQDMAAGRIDYLLQDAIASAGFLASEQGGCCEMKATLPNDPEVLGVGAGAGIRKEDAALLAKMNAAIAAVAKSGGFDGISKAHGLSGLIETPK